MDPNRHVENDDMLISLPTLSRLYKSTIISSRISCNENFMTPVIKDKLIDEFSPKSDTVLKTLTSLVDNSDSEETKCRQDSAESEKAYEFDFDERYGSLNLVSEITKHLLEKKDSLEYTSLDINSQVFPDVKSDKQVITAEIPVNDLEKLDDHPLKNAEKIAKLDDLTLKNAALSIEEHSSHHFKSEKEVVNVKIKRDVIHVSENDANECKVLESELRCFSDGKTEKHITNVGLKDDTSVDLPVDTTVILKMHVCDDGVDVREKADTEQSEKHMIHKELKRQELTVKRVKHQGCKLRGHASNAHSHTGKPPPPPPRQTKNEKSAGDKPLPGKPVHANPKLNDNTRIQNSPRTDVDDTANQPPPDYKAVKKKHQQLDLLEAESHAEPRISKPPDDLSVHGEPPTDLATTLGVLKQDRIPSNHPGITALEHCLVQCIWDLQCDVEPWPRKLSCQNCLLVSSLLTHFGRCSKLQPDNCVPCWQLFRLINVHLGQCCMMGSSMEECKHELNMCRRIHRQIFPKVADGSSASDFLWEKLKGFSARNFITNLGILQDKKTQTSLKKPALTRAQSGRKSQTYAPTLGMIPERSSMLGSLDLRSNGSSGGSTPAQALTPTNLNPLMSMGTHALLQQPSLHRPELPPYVRTIDGVSVYGASGPFSLPSDAQRPTDNGQLMSLVDRPQGEAGIGDVVYGNCHQLTLVANHWANLKQRYLNGEKISQKGREEGVILYHFMNDFELGLTRYQKDVQWQMLSYLGRGVSGKCHLAKDLNTDHQFCVKEMLLSHYEPDEVRIWCTLDHKHIVRLYGAVRDGLYVYLFSEFIDGGCLTEHIANQRRLKRRLSKWAALKYHCQILEVLRYLQHIGVLHEDLKADNILLRQGSTELVVADFGLARCLQDGQLVPKCAPLGTQTQWSPEKAASEGYDFRADVWAATCVLAHIFNGYPPWFRKFGYVGALHVIIKMHSPPEFDLPQNVTEDILNLIRIGWTVDPHRRPNAQMLLKHHAFTPAATQDPHEFSIINTTTHSIEDNIQHLESICKGLENQQKFTPAGTGRNVIEEEEDKDAGTEKKSQMAELHRVVSPNLRELEAKMKGITTPLGATAEAPMSKSGDGEIPEQDTLDSKIETMIKPGV